MTDALHNTHVESLIDMLRRAGRDADAGVTFVSSASDEVFLSYADLYAESLRTLGYLQSRGLGEGDEVIFQIEDTRSFIVMFWACMLGKIIPVPVNSGTQRDVLLKVLLIWEILKRPTLAAEAKALERFRQLDLNNEHTAVMTEILRRKISVEDALAWPEDGIPVPVRPEDLAYIQFSSGSTGDPRGVLLSHSNIWHTIGDIAAAADARRPDYFLGWLPLTHDMGLIGTHLMPMRAGIPQALMPPSLFIRRPLLWMEKASRHRASMLVSPNFGYHYFLSAFDSQKDYGWDLSHIKYIYNGAEPISERVCSEFVATLRRYGLRPSVKPCYGLAEASLAVTLTGVDENYPIHHVHRGFLNKGDQVVFLPDSSNDDAIVLVDVGRAVPSDTIRIVDEADREMEDETIGSIQVTGATVTSGYYNNPEATRSLFTPDGWLRTGDLGFIRNGRLVVTGREKEIIILGGQNYYPFDIEGAIHQAGLAEPGKVVAGGCHSSSSEAKGPAVTESLVVFIQAKADPRDFLSVARQVKDVVLSQVGVAVDHVIPVPRIPKTTSGKFQRHKLIQQFDQGLFDETIQELEALDLEVVRPAGFAIGIQEETRKSLLEFVLATARALLQCDQVDAAVPLTDQGMDSKRAVELLSRIATATRLKLPASVFFEHPTPAGLAAYLARRVSGRPMPVQEARRDESAVSFKAHAQPSSNEPIAIIGMACRFPGQADSPEKFWQVLKNGVDTVRTVPPDRWDADLLYDPDPAAPGKMYCREGSFLERVDEFDAEFFGVSPKAAIYQDPQQRLLLEITWEALENACQNIGRLRGTNTGVFLGLGNVDYQQITMRLTDLTRINQHSMIGVLNCVASGRLSYFFGFHGPSMTIDTACSSSLVSVHEACSSLRLGECDMAVAGGISLILTPHGSVGLCKIQALAPDGRCKTFDQRADGYGRGEGGGMVVLKRLSDATRDGDPVLAVILGSAVNQDGRSNGLTAPNGLAQQAVIRQALRNSGVTADRISYVEAHGTGTQLGDPLELQSMDEVYNGHRAPQQPLLVGSVKSNIGHLEAGAAAASLVKVVLSLQKREIPPNLHFERPSSQIPWTKLNVRIPTQPTVWEAADGRRLAGLSSFAINGTNAHAVLEEAPEPDAQLVTDRKMSVLTLSARTGSALQDYARRYSAFLPSAGKRLTDILGTTNATKTAFDNRLAVVGADCNEICALLQAFLEGKQRQGLIHNRCDKGQQPEIVFQFTGQGSQSIRMGMELYRSSYVFRHWMDRCEKYIRQFSGRSILGVIMGRSGEHALHETVNTQPAVFAVDYALYQMFRSYGVAPDAVLGHSIGEYVAACVAGVFSLEEAIQLVVQRAELMNQLPAGGGMLSILATEEQAGRLIRDYLDTVSVAAVNGPNQTVISGDSQQLARIREKCVQSGLIAILLTVSHAFHSPLMDPILEKFSAAVRNAALRPPSLPLISNLTGKPVDAAEICRPDYWVRHLRNPVRFHDSIAHLRQAGFTCFVECGPSPILTGLGEKLGDRGVHWIASMRPRTREWSTFLQAIGSLFTLGVDIDWEPEKEFYSRKVATPTYPFQRQRYWVAIEEQPGAPVQTQSAAGRVADAEILDLAWAPAGASAARGLPQAQSEEAGWIVLFNDAPGKWNVLREHLQTRGWRIAEVLPAIRFEENARGFIRTADLKTEPSPPSFNVNAQDRGHFRQLLERIRAQSLGAPLHILYSWTGLGDLPVNARQATVEEIQRACEITLGGLLHLVQSLEELSLSPRLTVLTRPVHCSEMDGCLPFPEDAPLIGLIKVIDRELPRFHAAAIECASAEDSLNLSLLEGQLFDPNRPVWAKIEAGRLFHPSLKLLAPPGSSTVSKIRDDRSYLVTGGFGTLGMHTADWLVRRGARHIVLMGRSGRRDGCDSRIDSWKRAGVRCMEIACDIGSEQDAEAAFRRIREAMPELKGIVHCAGVLEDATITNLQWTGMQKTLAPKAYGAWNIHQQSLDLELDFLVFFSSMTSLVGNAGQGSYAAANAFLDSLAHYRKGIGLPAVSICWGAWSVGGMGSENRMLNRILERMGVRRFAPESGFEALDQILRLGGPQYAVASFDRNRIRPEAMGGLLRGSSFRFTSGQAQAEADREESVRLRQKISAVSREQGIEIVIDFLVRESRSILGLDPDRPLSLHGSFFDIGFDSLMITQLRNVVSQRLLDKDLPVSSLFAYNSVGALGSHLYDECRVAAGGSQAEQTYTKEETELLSIDDDLVEEVARLSDEEIENLL